MPLRPTPPAILSPNPYICRSCLAALRLNQQTVATRPFSQSKPSSARATLTRAPRLKAQKNQRATNRLTRLQRQAAELDRPPDHLSAATQAVKEPPAARPQELDDGNIVRYWDQDLEGIRQEVDAGDDFDDESDPGKFQRDLEALEAGLEAKSKELNSKLTTLEGFRQVLRKYGFGAAAEELEKDPNLANDLVTIGRDGQDDDTTEVTIPQIAAKGRQRQDWAKKINDLNKWLRRAVRMMQGDKTTSKDVQYIWRAYSMARPVLAMDWDVVPKTAWKVLWSAFSWDDKRNPNRMGHVAVIAADMAKAGIELQQDQELLYVEALFINDQRDKAVETWRRANTTLGEDSSTRDAYWELGVRILALQGDLERAERAIDSLFERSTDVNARVMLHYIRACAQAGKTQEAMRSYERMRRILGNDMTIEDYDEVGHCFLGVGSTKEALTVFVDMMYSGAINLRDRRRLPSNVSNHFFMGKWLKRLIGAGDLDGAYQVLVLMQTAGIMAAAVQVNGLLGAWLRTEEASNLQKAESLAWAMIRSRQMYVDLRKREALLDWPIQLMTGVSKSKQVDNKELVYVPRASLETFCLMAENYRSRNMHNQLGELWVAFKECELSGDSFMMNQLIESHVQQGQGHHARDLYHLMVNENKILPDAHTFYALFKSLDCNSSSLSTQSEQSKAKDRDMCRAIFQDMLQNAYVFEREEDGMSDMHAKMILHSFRKCDDILGLLVALQVLKELIGFKMTQGVLMELIAEMDTDLTKPSERIRKRLIKATQYVAKTFAELEGGPDGEVSEDGTEAAFSERELNMPDEERVDHSYAVIQMYYRDKINAGTDEFIGMYRATAAELGLS